MIRMLLFPTNQKMFGKNGLIFKMFATSRTNIHKFNPFLFSADSKILLHFYAIRAMFMVVHFGFEPKLKRV